MDADGKGQGTPEAIGRAGGEMRHVTPENLMDDCGEHLIPYCDDPFLSEH